MGLLQSAGRFLGGVIESVGKAIGSKPTENYGKKLKERCTEAVDRTSGYVGSRDPYSPQRASVPYVEDLNGVLIDFKNEIDEVLAGVNQDGRDLVVSYAKTMKENASETVEEYDFALDFSAVDKCVKRIQKSLATETSQLINSHVSLSNEKCKSILMMAAGSSKETAMKAFTKECVNECIDAIGSAVETGCKQIDDELIKALSAKIADLKRHTEIDSEGITKPP